MSFYTARVKTRTPLRRSHVRYVLADETEVIEPDERRQRNGKDESTEPEMQNEGGEIVELKARRLQCRHPQIRASS
jgi:hypothetical protein